MKTQKEIIQQLKIKYKNKQTVTSLLSQLKSKAAINAAIEIIYQESNSKSAGHFGKMASNILNKKLLSSEQKQLLYKALENAVKNDDFGWWAYVAKYFLYNMDYSGSKIKKEEAESQLENFLNLADAAITNAKDEYGEWFIKIIRPIYRVVGARETYIYKILDLIQKGNFIENDDYDVGDETKELLRDLVGLQAPDNKKIADRVYEIIDNLSDFGKCCIIFKNEILRDKVVELLLNNSKVKTTEPWYSFVPGLFDKVDSNILAQIIINALNSFYERKHQWPEQIERWLQLKFFMVRDYKNQISPDKLQELKNFTE